MNGVVKYLRGNNNDPEVLASGPSSLTATDKLAKGLGWFSIALGITELVAARRVTRAFGLEGRENVVRAFGVREIGAGVMTLSLDKGVGLWSRVAGDVLDLLFAGTALDAQRAYQRRNAKIALLALAGIAVVDIFAARAVGAQKARDAKPRKFGSRSGFPCGVQAARGAAKDLKIPSDMRDSMRARG